MINQTYSLDSEEDLHISQWSDSEQLGTRFGISIFRVGLKAVLDGEKYGFTSRLL